MLFWHLRRTSFDWPYLVQDITNSHGTFLKPAGQKWKVESTKRKTTEVSLHCYYTKHCRNWILLPNIQMTTRSCAWKFGWEWCFPGWLTLSFQRKRTVQYLFWFRCLFTVNSCYMTETTASSFGESNPTLHCTEWPIPRSQSVSPCQQLCKSEYTASYSPPKTGILVQCWTSVQPLLIFELARSRRKLRWRSCAIYLSVVLMTPPLYHFLNSVLQTIELADTVPLARHDSKLGRHGLLLIVRNICVGDGHIMRD